LWECQSGLSLQMQEHFRGRGSAAGSICGMQPVEVKGKLHKELGICRFGSQLVVKPLS
jgi:hypothetical protein